MLKKLVHYPKRALFYFIKNGLRVINLHFTPLIPLEAAINITNKCNSRCIYCETNLCDTSNELTTQQLISIIDDIGKYRVSNISLGGGEPFLRPDIFDILEHCGGRKVCVNILTNGLIIHKMETNQISILKNCVNHITMSIDSANAKENDFIRGREGSLNLVIKGIKHLKSSGFKNISIATVVSKYNFKSLDKLLYLVKNLGLQRIRFQPVGVNSNFPQVSAIKNKANFLIKEETPELMKILKECLVLGKAMGVVSNLQFLITWIEPYFKFADTDKFFMLEVDKNFKCYFPFNALCINNSGKLLPCSFLREVDNCDGNIISKWRHNTKLNEIRRCLEKGGLFSECHSCMCMYAANRAYETCKNPPTFIRSIRRKLLNFN